MQTMAQPKKRLRDNVRVLVGRVSLVGSSLSWTYHCILLLVNQLGVLKMLGLMI